jgi:hypothetical protein
MDSGSDTAQNKIETVTGKTQTYNAKVKEIKQHIATLIRDKIQFYKF